MSRRVRFGWNGWLQPAGWCWLCDHRIRRWPFALTLDKGRVHLRCAPKADDE